MDEHVFCKICWGFTVIRNHTDDKNYMGQIPMVHELITHFKIIISISVTCFYYKSLRKFIGGN